MSLLVPLALSAGGAVASRLFSGSRPDLPDIPDFLTPALRRTNTEYDIAEQRRRRQGRSAMDDLQANLAARGVTGSGGVSAQSELQRTNAQATADLSARRAAELADVRTRAENQRKRMEYQRDLQGYQGDMAQWQQRAQGISDIFGSLGSYYTYNKLANPDQSTMEMLGIGNLFSGKQSPSLPSQAMSVFNPFSAADANVSINNELPLASFNL